LCVCIVFEASPGGNDAAGFSPIQKRTLLFSGAQILTVQLRASAWPDMDFSTFSINLRAEKLLHKMCAGYGG
jgi:hypothetical protein